MVPPRLTLVSDNTRDRDDDASGTEAGNAAAAAPSYADPEAMVDNLAQRQRREKIRRIEALLFAASEPLDVKSLMRALEDGDDVEAMLARQARHNVS